MAESLGDSPEERADNGVNNGDQPGAGTAKASDHPSAESRPHDNLPMVVSPKLGAGNEEVEEDETLDEHPHVGASSANAPSMRFVVLAASVAFTAASGSFIGSVSGSGMAHYLFPPPAAALASQNVNEAMRAMKSELTAAIKADFDKASRSADAQLAKLGDRLDPRAASTPETTGLIAPPAAVPGVAAKITDRILEDWMVQGVQNGRALVESRNGGLFDVGAGSVLSGLGRVETVKRQDGQWIVVTSRGMITSGR
jgi:hypothetical protein